MAQSRSYEEYSGSFGRVFESVCHSYCDDSGVFALLESDLLVDFNLLNTYMMHYVTCHLFCETRLTSIHHDSHKVPSEYNHLQYDSYSKSLVKHNVDIQCNEYTIHQYSFCSNSRLKPKFIGGSFFSLYVSTILRMCNDTIDALNYYLGCLI